jgi:Tfp pilus assembly protein PilN
MSKLWPTNMKFGGTPGAATFLPDEYVRRKREMRTNMLALGLFAAVMAGVGGAFFVTNRQWREVRVQQEAISVEYDAEALKIDQLKKLEAQRKDMLEKAEVAAMLLEKVPRSILLAEVVNRMPEKMTLTEFAIQSKRIAEPPPPNATKKAQPKSLSAKTGSGKNQAAAGKDAPGEPPAPKPRPPKLEFSILINGVASTDADIADFQASLRDCPLLRGVEWRESKATTIEETQLRQFVLEAVISPGADTRSLVPIQASRAKPHVVEPEKAPDPKSLIGALLGGKPEPKGKRKQTANVPTP